MTYFLLVRTINRSVNLKVGVAFIRVRQSGSRHPEGFWDSNTFPSDKPNLHSFIPSAPFPGCSGSQTGLRQRAVRLLNATARSLAHADTVPLGYRRSFLMSGFVLVAMETDEIRNSGCCSFGGGMGGGGGSARWQLNGDREGPRAAMLSEASHAGEMHGGTA